LAANRARISVDRARLKPKIWLLKFRLRDLRALAKRGREQYWLRRDASTI
jgi:hypothetical protein